MQGVYYGCVDCDERNAGAGNVSREDLAQSISFSGPTANDQPRAPIQATVAVTTNGQKKDPVRSSRKPVITGALAPTTFATKFSKPIQRPIMRGPASVCG